MSKRGGLQIDRQLHVIKRLKLADAALDTAGDTGQIGCPELPYGQRAVGQRTVQLSLLDRHPSDGQRPDIRVEIGVEPGKPAG